MTDRIGSSNPLAREAILAALKAQAGQSASVQEAAKSVADHFGTGTVREADFGSIMADGLRAIQGEINTAEKLPEDIVTGKVEDFHEVAIQLKRADVTFKFAMEIRNKLIDAYREIMRMSV